MEKVYIKARAKVNLSLAVLDKNEDGYHNLDSVFQKINLYDEMFLEKIEQDEFILDSNIKDVKLEDNIIYKAYSKLKETESFGGVKVTLRKNIPMQAGLAGGSTDCASFLIAIRKLYDLKISNEKLKEIGKSLGADVVPCMYNGAVWAQGIGEKIKIIDSDFKYYFVIIKPKFSCNTGEMYKRLDEEEKLEISTTSNIIDALENKNFEKLSNNLMNNFESVLNKNEAFLKAKEAIESEGAKALLAGSGSCVFGIFEKKELAKKAYRNLKEIYETYICTSYNLRRNNFGK